MPVCYLLTVCQASSLDQTTNNWSLFGLTEAVQSRQFPLQLPFEIHVHLKFELDEHETDFEVRLVLISPTGETTLSQPLALRSSTPRHRLRVNGLPLIPSPGSYQVRVEWRIRGAANWTISDGFWPLIVEELQPAGT